MATAPYPLLQQQIDDPQLPEGFYSRPESWRDKMASFLAGDDRFRYQKMQELLGGGPQGSAVNPLGAPFNLQEAMVNKDAIGAASSIPGPGMIEGMLAKGGAAALGKIGAGALGKAMLVGPMGLMTDKAALAKAEQMMAKGAPADEIWQAHRWADVSPQGGTQPLTGNKPQWVSEVYDPPNNMKPIPPGGGRWADIMDNPEFFANYPQLADMRVSRLQGQPEGYRGAYFNNDPRMEINPKNPIDIQRSTMHHEGTHAVEHLEGWPGGSSSQNIMVYPGGPGWDIFQKKIAEMQQNPLSFDDFKKTMLSPNVTDFAANASYKSYKKNLKDAHNLDWNNPVVQYAEQVANFQAYLNTSGEALAREGATRSTWPEAQRKLLPPGLAPSADVPRSQQIPGPIRPWPGVINPFPKQP